MSRAVFWSVALAFGGCSPIGAEQGAGRSADAKQAAVTEVGFVKLSGAEIERLLVGRALMFQKRTGAVTLMSYSREHYLANGILILVGDRGRSRGTYEVGVDRICIDIENGSFRQCRRLYRSTEGNYFAAILNEHELELGRTHIIIND